MEAAGRSLGGAFGLSWLERWAYRLRVAGEVAGHVSSEAGRAKSEASTTPGRDGCRCPRGGPASEKDRE